MTPFAGKKIWLVGASEGIGEAVARMLAASGAQMALSARNEKKLEALVEELPGAAHISAPLDVTNPDSVKFAWKDIAERWQGVDMVIYNAGTYDPMGAQKFDLAKTEQMVDVNFRGALRILDCVIPGMVQRKGGHIVLVSSVAAYRGLPNAIGYGASKAALLHLAENLKLDLEPCNIKVQAVCPGFVKTRLTEKNEFPMPFIVEADVAAQRIVKGMAGDAFEIHFPRRFSCMLKTLALLPHALYFPLARKAR